MPEKGIEQSPTVFCSGLAARRDERILRLEQLGHTRNVVPGGSHMTQSIPKLKIVFIWEFPILQNTQCGFRFPIVQENVSIQFVVLDF